MQKKKNVCLWQKQQKYNSYNIFQIFLDERRNVFCYPEPGPEPGPVNSSRSTRPGRLRTFTDTIDCLKKISSLSPQSPALTSVWFPWQFGYLQKTVWTKEAVNDAGDALKGNSALSWCYGELHPPPPWICVYVCGRVDQSQISSLVRSTMTNTAKQTWNSSIAAKRLQQQQKKAWVTSGHGVVSKQAAELEEFM